MLTIFCSGNEKIGLGHIRRCVNLANLLRENMPDIKIKFYGEYSEFALNFLKLNHIESKLAALDEFIENCSSSSHSFLLIDSYNFSAEHAQSLTKKNIKWGAFDDFNDHDFFGACFVINFRIGADCKYSSKLSLLGPKFMPVDPILEQTKLKRRESPIPNNVLVCIGSSDLYNIAGHIVNTLSNIYENYQWILVSNNHYDIVFRNNISQHRITNSIYQIMKDVKFAISGGGGIKYEACYMGIPCLVYSQTEGEYEDTLILESKSMIINGELAKNFDSNKLIKNFSILIQSEADLIENCNAMFSNNNLNIFRQISPFI